MRRALSQALAEVADLAGNAAGEAADMLGFQVAMLSDDELVRPALEAVEAGESAAAAWQAAMDAEIAGYRAAGDDHFAARTADLEDIRDRVLGHLTPGAAGPVDSGRRCGRGGRPADLALPRHRLGAGRRDRAHAGQSQPAMSPCWRGRAACRWSSGLDGDAVAMAGREALVDAATGEVVLNPHRATRVAFAAKAQTRKDCERRAAAAFSARPAVTRDGTRIALNLNAGSAR